MEFDTAPFDAGRNENQRRLGHRPECKCVPGKCQRKIALDNAEGGSNYMLWLNCLIFPFSLVSLRFIKSIIPKDVKKTRRKKPKANKAPTMPSPHPQSLGALTPDKPLNKNLKRFVYCVGFIGTCVGLLGAYFQFQPLVSVSPDTSLNPKDAFSTPFAICNESVLSIFQVSHTYTVNHIFAENNVEMFGGTWVNKGDRIVPQLRPKESTPVMINWAFVNKPVFCDVTINVTYRPAFLWWYKKQTFRFSTQTNSDGQVVWYRRAQSEPGAGW